MGRFLTEGYILRFRRVLFTVFVVGVFSLALSLAAVAKPSSFVLHNVTGVDLHRVYVSSSGEAEWGEDLLDKDEILKDGGDIEVEFSPGTDAVQWDMRVEDSDGNALEFSELELLDAETVILNADGTAIVK